MSRRRRRWPGVAGEEGGDGSVAVALVVQVAWLLGWLRGVYGWMSSCVLLDVCMPV